MATIWDFPIFVGVGEVTDIFYWGGNIENFFVQIQFKFKSNQIFNKKN
jgi:hypothetical protein